MKDDRDELRVMMAHGSAIKSDLSWLPKPWLLKGEAESEYWRHVYDQWMECWANEHAGIPAQPEPEIPPEVEAMIEEDNQFWNYKDDIIPDEEGEMPRWKYAYPQMWDLFEWLPWGKPGCFCQIQASSAELMKAAEDEVMALGEPQVRLLVINEDRDVLDVSGMTKAGDKKPKVLIVEGSINSDDSSSLSFWSNMAHSSKNFNSHGSG